VNATTIAQTVAQTEADAATTSRYTILDREKPALRHLVKRWESLLALLNKHPVIFTALVN